VTCGTPIDGLGTTAQTAQLQDFRFFVSEVELIRRNGRAVTVKLAPNSAYRYTRGGVGVTLIDLENGAGACAVDVTKRMNASVKGTVPRGEYVGAAWTVGVPFALDHTDAAATPAPLNSAAMGWSWQVGRKFAKIECRGRPTRNAAAWSRPSASTGGPTAAEPAGRRPGRRRPWSTTRRSPGPIPHW
jgi:uncharacterized repeat protein (TIGR04052 family)